MTDQTHTPNERESATTEPESATTERESATTTVVAPPEEERDEQRFTRDETAVVPREWEPVRERRTLAPVVGEDTVLAMRARQRSRFGGIRWGSAFFGLLSAIGLAVILGGIIAAVGAAVGISEIQNVARGDADTIGLGGTVVVLAALGVAWYSGGYAAARMARFDGARQGVGVWTWTVVIAGALAILAFVAGNDYNVLHQLNVPDVSVGNASQTSADIVTGAAALVVTLVCAIVGGIAGDRYHRRVDRFAAREYYEVR